MNQVLVCNCGSSSIKIDVFDSSNDLAYVASARAERLNSDDAVIGLKVVDAGKTGGNGDKNTNPPVETRTNPGRRDHAAALREIAAMLAQAEVFLPEARVAVGHRVVHGGGESLPLRLNEQAVALIEKNSELAPLHNPVNLIGIRLCAELFDVPQACVFDTAFHATLPDFAYTYGLPAEMAARHRIRRYGFHGTSHEYVARKAAEALGRSFAESRIITLHLGNGASACAIQNGRSVDTSMGFTPLEGLLMGTRAGDLDPALPGLLIEREGLSPDEVDLLLNKGSGLKGICGHNDMRDVMARADGGDQDCRLARDVFCYRVRQYIGAYLAVLGGADAVVFTAGIGENAPEVRRRSLLGLEFAGLRLDEKRNESPEKMRISTDDSPVAIFVVPTDEEWMIAHKTLNLIGGGSEGGGQRPSASGVDR